MPCGISISRVRCVSAMAAACLVIALAGCSKSKAPATAASSAPAAATPAASSQASSAAPAQPANTQSASGSAVASRHYAPASQQPQAAPQQAAAPAPVPMVTIPAGTELAIMINQSLGSDISSVDQPVVGQVNRPVVVGGDVVVPRGARVNGRVTVATSSGHFKGRSELALRLVSLEFNGHTYPLSGEWYALGPSRGSRTAKVIGGGAGIGALVGALVGHGKGAAIGAAIGAGAGTADSALTTGKPVDLSPESVINVRLTSSVSVHPANALLQ